MGKDAEGCWMNQGNCGFIKRPVLKLMEGFSLHVGSWWS